MSKADLSSAKSTHPQTSTKSKITMTSIPKPPRNNVPSSQKKNIVSSVQFNPSSNPSYSMTVGQSSSGGPTNNFTPVKATQTKPRTRFSLRRFFYTNPLLSPPFSRSQNKKKPRKSCDRDSPFTGLRGVLGGADSETGDTGSCVTAGDKDNYSTGSSVALGAVGGSLGAGSSVSDPSAIKECPVCLAETSADQFPNLRNCHHLACIECMQLYVRIEIQEGRINLKCPQCSEILHPNDIEMLVGEDSQLLHLYESLMMRRVLAADPDTRWCPAPNCTFAVVATGCASCPKINCEREGCDFSFCYHCKAEWHPNQTCDMARAQRQPVRSSSISFTLSGESGSGVGVAGGGSELKVCPRCSVLIVKMDDGSCNHMTCAVCGSEFCWLCMKEISDLHYLSPSGCTFWGKKPWSRKKKLMWQLGTLVGAPVGIAMIAGIAIPAMIIGIPVWVGRKIHSRYQTSGKHKRNLAITSGVTASVVVSPLIAGLAVSIGVPILLAYVYGVVPISLCRSGGCGVHTTTSGVKIDVDEEVPYNKASTEVASSRVANPSIGEVSLGASLSLGSGSHLDRVGGSITGDCDRESASNTGIAGHSLTGSVASSYIGHQRLEVGADVHPRNKYSFSSERLSETVSLSEKSASVSLAEDGASTRALAGSLLAYRIEKMENSSVNSYRAGFQTPGSCGSASVSQGTAADVDSAIYPCYGYSGDEISLKSMPGASSQHPRSLSPVSSMSGEELTAALRRSRRRQPGMSDKQLSCDSQDPESALDRVRFDDNVSFIEAAVSLSPEETDPADTRLTFKKCDLDSGSVREETAEELAMVVSPHMSQHRHTSSSSGQTIVPSIEVVSPWKECWVPQSPANSDQTPLLDSSPSSSQNTSHTQDEECHVSNITVVTDTTELADNNVTSISIDHDSNSFYNSSEHDNEATVSAQNVSYITLPDTKPEPVKIKISADPDGKAK